MFHFNLSSDSCGSIVYTATEHSSAQKVNDSVAAGRGGGGEEKGKK